jgi:hypothetical protein
MLLSWGKTRDKSESGGQLGIRYGRSWSRVPGCDNFWYARGIPCLSDPNPHRCHTSASGLLWAGTGYRSQMCHMLTFSWWLSLWAALDHSISQAFLLCAQGSPICVLDCVCFLQFTPIINPETFRL